MVNAVPTLAEVVRDTERLIGLPFDTLWALLGEVGRVERQITAAMVPAALSVTAQVTGPVDRLLTIAEAAARLHVAEATMQKWLRKPPYDAAVVVRSRSMVRVSSQHLDAILLGGGLRVRRKAGAA